MFERAPIGTALIESSTRRIFDANDRFAQIVGRSRAELPGVDWADITHPEDIALNQREAGRLVAGEITDFKLTKRFIRPDGTSVWVDLWVVAVDADDQGRLHHLCMIDDITERRNEAVRLVESERRYRLLADNAGDVVLLFRDGLIDWIAPSVRHLLGYMPEELIGTRTLDLVHPDDHALLLGQREVLLSGQSIRVRARFRRSDGTWLWVEYNSHLVVDNERPVGDVAVTTMWNIQAEMDALDRLGEAQAKARAVEMHAHHAARLESLGVLAGGIAHDFNNLLASILGNAELALLGVGPDSPARIRLDSIVAASGRGASLTRQLLDYAGGRPASTPEPIAVAAALARSLELVAPVLDPSVVVEMDVESDLPLALCDPGDWQQIIFNLVTNAAEAMEGRGGHVTARVSGSHTSGHVCIEVIDDGAGMPAEVIARVFEPFFTTKVNGHGLGLAVVHGIVRANGGTIKFESTPGEGTVARVVLPAAVGGARDSDVPARPAVVAAVFDRTILVVDDNDEVRATCSLILESSGLTALAASTGTAAVASVASSPERFGLALVDLSMPGMDGTEVVRAIRAIVPEMPTIVMSGYASFDIQRKLEAVGVDAVLHKPFRATELLAMVRDVLSRSGERGGVVQPTVE